MSETPGDPGWDRDPAGPGSWLDPERRNAAIGLGVLVLLAGGIVGAAILFTDPPQPPQADGLSVLDEASPPPADPDAPEEDVASDDTSPEGLVEPDDGEEDEPFDEGAEEAPSDAQIDFDGVCTVTVGGEEASGEGDEDVAAEVPEGARPWHFDECTSAPVALEDDGDQRWIVVLASLPRNEYDEGSARERAIDLGFDDQVLYSSHYPSLNPDLWVVYDGPFDGEDDARAAAGEHGGGAYPRVLADEAGDRY